MEGTSALNGNGIYYIRFWNDIYLYLPSIWPEILIIAEKNQLHITAEMIVITGGILRAATTTY